MFEKSTCFCPESLRGTGRFFSFHSLGLGQKGEKSGFHPICQNRINLLLYYGYVPKHPVMVSHSEGSEYGIALNCLQPPENT